jgi:hypothetical protein
MAPPARAGGPQGGRPGRPVNNRPIDFTEDQPVRTRQFAQRAEPPQRTAEPATDPAKMRSQQPAFDPGKPEPSLRQLLQQAHSRDGERLLAPDDDPNPFTVQKQSVPGDFSGPEFGARAGLVSSVWPSRPEGSEAAARHDLTEQISSILADEARRHGIDV